MGLKTGAADGAAGDGWKTMGRPKMEATDGFEETDDLLQRANRTVHLYCIMHAEKIVFLVYRTGESRARKARAQRTWW
jgi:hypothetical protein